MMTTSGAQGPPPSKIGSNGRAGLNQRKGVPADAVDGFVPERVVQIRNVDDSVEVVRSAIARRDRLVIRGGGTLLSIGNRPRELTAIVSLSSMDRVLSYSPEDMVVTTEAGITLSALDRELAAAGQWVPLQATAPEVATLGGLVAANVNSGIAYAFGYPRDQVLGMTVVDGTGRVLRAGGRVVKNVAGYDLPRTFTGSFGTLAVINDVTLRTQPRPEALKQMTIDFPDAVSLERIRQQLFSARLPLHMLDLAVECMDGNPRWSLHVSTGGTAKQVEHVIDSLTASARREGGCPMPPRQSGHESDDAHENFIARFAATPSTAITEANTLLELIRNIVPASRVLMECGGALLRLHAGCSAATEVKTLLQICQQRSREGAGAVVFERLPPDQKSDVDVWHGPILGLPLMRRLKGKFDPNGIFAPGRFVGGI